MRLSTHHEVQRATARYLAQYLTTCSISAAVAPAENGMTEYFITRFLRVSAGQ
jgi:hypothetical protein